jgi:hypothetical protein
MTAAVRGARVGGDSTSVKSSESRKKELDMQRHQRALSTSVLALLGATLGVGSTAFGDDWRIRMTVDNQYTAYYGTPTATIAPIGSDSNWGTVETYNLTGRPSTDYFYVATASDHGGYQGFLGHFENTTTGAAITTGSSIWEVFPAGQYAAQLGLPSPWPPMVMPTQLQVDNAIAYASANNLWRAPDGFQGWDADENTPAPSPYTVDAWAAGTFWPQQFQAAGIPRSAEWIWHDSTQIDPPSGTPDPFGAFNHNEFLVFRIKGEVPEPSALGLCVLPVAAMRRGRKRSRIQSGLVVHP